MKKVMTMILAAAMCMSMAVGAMANEESVSEKAVELGTLVGTSYFETENGVYMQEAYTLVEPISVVRSTEQHYAQTVTYHITPVSVSRDSHSENDTNDDYYIGSTIYYTVGDSTDYAEAGEGYNLYKVTARITGYSGTSVSYSRMKTYCFDAKYGSGGQKTESLSGSGTSITRNFDFGDCYIPDVVTAIVGSAIEFKVDNTTQTFKNFIVNEPIGDM